MSWRLPNFSPIRTIGASRTGTVVLSQDDTTGALYAVKYLTAEVCSAPGFTDTYRRDAARLMGLEHDALVGVFEFVEQAESAAVVEEFVDGVSLRRVIAGAPLDPQAALYVIKSALTGLSAAHQQQLVHRDFRPDNVFVTANLQVKVTDLGIPLPPGYGSGIAGDAHYRAPELWYGQGASPSADVFAVAATLAECFTGEPAMAPGGRPVGFAVATGGDGTPMLPAALPEPIALLVERCLAASPEQRPADAAAMLDELRIAAVIAFGDRWEEAARASLAMRTAALAQSTSQAGAAPTERRRWFPRALALTAQRRAGCVLTASVAAAIICVGLVLLIVAPSRGSDALVSRSAAIPGPVVGGRASAGPSGGDTAAPDPITGLAVTSRAQTAISLVWDAAPDDAGVTGYIVQRDGTTVGTSSAPGFTDQGLGAKTTYTYTVIALDAAGNQSDASTPVTATTLAAPDKTPPSAPTSLRVTARGDTTITLSWAAAKDDVGVAGYAIFRNGVQIGTVSRPGFRDTGLKAAKTYTYQVRAYDASGNNSTLSAKLSTTTLAAPKTTPPANPTTKTPSPPPPQSTPSSPPGRSESPTPSPSSTAEQATSTPTADTAIAGEPTSYSPPGV